MVNKKQVNKKPETMGHEWDGIQEYNNPVPLWWKTVFLGCTLYAIGYMIYYPSIPFAGKNGYFAGIGNWSQFKELDQEIAKGKELTKDLDKQIIKLTIEEIEANPELKEYAIATGKSRFAMNCSQCHGLGANGNKGVANLLDDEWIWGSDIENIRYTITNGVRDYTNDDTRDGEMAAFGLDEILDKREIKDVVRYVQVLAYNASENASSDRGKEIFEESCTACHGDAGEGNQELGAPALNNQVWLYGGDRKTLIETITEGRAANMTAFKDIISEDDIKRLVVFVRSLSDIEDKPASE